MYHKLLVNGEDAIDEMMEVARNTEHPRAFEVLGNLIKTMADVNGSLLDLHKKKKDIRTKDVKNALPPPSTTNNNLFVGSTADLQRLLLKQQQEDTTKVINLDVYRDDTTK
jgi:hypothetical protein